MSKGAVRGSQRFGRAVCNMRVGMHRAYQVVVGMYNSAVCYGAHVGAMCRGKASLTIGSVRCPVSACVPGFPGPGTALRVFPGIRAFRSCYMCWWGWGPGNVRSALVARSGVVLDSDGTCFRGTAINYSAVERVSISRNPVRVGGVTCTGSLCPPGTRALDVRSEEVSGPGRGSGRVRDSLCGSDCGSCVNGSVPHPGAGALGFGKEHVRICIGHDRGKAVSSSALNNVGSGPLSVNKGVC